MHSERPNSLFGFRHRPGRLARRLLRVPLPLYHRGWGTLLGHTFLLITHEGRRSHKLRETVAMALAFDRESQETIVCSAWGANADWIRNIEARPATRIQIGGDVFAPEQRFLAEPERVAVLVEFGRRHPWRMRLIGTILGWGDLRPEPAARDFVRDRPFVAFRPHVLRERSCDSHGSE